MKKWAMALMGVVFIFTQSFNLHAQEITTEQPVDSLSAYDAALQLLESVPPVPTESLPGVGTFWSAQHAPGSAEPWPPLPGNILGLGAWSLGDGVFLLADTNVDYVELQAEAEETAQAQAALVAIAGRNTSSRNSMMAMSLASSYAYGNPAYITNMTAIPSGYGDMIDSFGIGGGTNFVPYDILTTTNVAMKVAQWTWLGIGYTSNNYTFYGQPADMGFYILAKPSKTMTVGWGGDVYDQCDVPSGITNILMVAGGYGYSLGLLNNGTVVGWGNSSADGYVPTNLVNNVAMIASAWDHNVALLTNGTVIAWGANVFGILNVPANLTNATVISAQALNTLALRGNGTVVAWGDNDFGQCNVPSGLTNVTAIAAGGEHSLAVSNGIVVAWGDNYYGQCNVPAGLSNVVDVAASGYHSLALLNNGTVVAWGDNSFGETNVPAGLNNVVAIAAGGDSFLDDFYLGDALPCSLALKSDGTVVAWGDGDVFDPVAGLNNVIFIGGGAYHALAVRTGPPTPVITLEPADEYQAVGGNVTFTARGAGLYGVTHQWQTNGMDLAGATNAVLTLTNLLASQAGSYDVVVTDNGGMGSITSSNANLNLVTPPVIISQTPMPTNQVCIYGNHLSFAVTATSPYQTNGFPLTYQWQFNGANISGANANSYGFFATNNLPGIYSVIVANAAGSVSASWQLTLTNINVTNDLLLIYNTNSADSATVENYYLAHRPMVSGANVLGVGCTNGEIIGSADFTNQILTPYLNWLAANPAKHPQYLVLFLGIPSRVEDGINTHPSVQYQLSTDEPGIQPYVTSINMNGTNDCIGYINKLASIGTNYSPGQLVISASAGGYGNTNYCLDNARKGLGFGTYNGITYGDGDFTGSGSTIYIATNGLIASGVSPSAIIYNDGLDTNGVGGLTSYTAPQITGATNVAGYICWGEHSALGETYAIDGTVKWAGNSSWWIIETVESFNGQVSQASPQGNFIQWFSSNAFGGTNYSNTPAGAVSHTEEPGLPGVENSATYFGLWAAGKNFAICAWSSRQTPFFQAVGDPLVTK